MASNLVQHDEPHFTASTPLIRPLEVDACIKRTLQKIALAATSTFVDIVRAIFAACVFSDSVSRVQK